MFRPCVRHPLFDGGLHVRRELCDIERLARANADLSKSLHQRGFRRNGRANPQDEVQDVEELRRRSLLSWCKRLYEINSRSGGGPGLSDKIRERRYLVACLHLLHIFEVTRIEELRAISGERQFGLGSKHFVDALGCLTFPARSGEKERPPSVAARASANVIEVLRVVVDELDAEIAILLHRWHGEYNGLGTQVSTDHGVKRIRVRRLDRLICWSEKPCTVPNFIPRSFVLAIFRIYEVGILDAIVVHDRKAINIRLLRDGAGFRRTNIGLSDRRCETERRK